MPESIESALQRGLEAALGPSGGGIVSVYLFGSQAAGRVHRESDVDVAVLFDLAAVASREERFEERLRLSGVISRALRRNDVDLVVLNDAPPTLAARVVTQGRMVFCSDREAEHAFRRDAQLRAADLRPFLLRFRRVALQAIRS